MHRSKLNKKQQYNHFCNFLNVPKKHFRTIPSPPSRVTSTAIPGHVSDTPDAPSASLSCHVSDAPERPSLSSLSFADGAACTDGAADGAADAADARRDGDDGETDTRAGRNLGSVETLGMDRTVLQTEFVCA